MAWYIAPSEIPGKPYAVLQVGTNEIMGCHPSRAAASIQMSTLYASENIPREPGMGSSKPAQPVKPVVESQTRPRREDPPPVAYSSSPTIAW